MTLDSIGQAARGLRRALTHPSAVAAHLALERDLAGFRRGCSFLAEAQQSQSEEPGKRLLVVSCTDWVAQLKVELLLATALRLHGWAPVILSRRGCRWASRYFAVGGIDQLMEFERWLDAGDMEAPEAADRLLREHSTIQALLKVRHNGVFVGRHALSTLVRSLRAGRLDLSDPNIASLVRRHLASSVRAAVAAERALEELRPDLVLFLEKGYTPYAEFFDAAVNRGLNTIQWGHGHRSDALTFKRYTSANRHEHPFSLTPQTWQSVRQMPWTEEQERELNAELAGRYHNGSWFSRKYLHVNRYFKEPEVVRAQLGLDQKKRTAVIFSHVLWDATFFYGENLFDDYEEWLIETVRVACANPAVNWVVKLHPDYVWKLKQLGSSEVRDRVALDASIGTLPPHVKLLLPEGDLETFSLFQVTDYCVTVRGTIGIEMACFGIPVFTAGTGRYAGFGFTIDSATCGEYLDRLRRVQDYPRLSSEQAELAKRHAYVLLACRPLPFQTFRMVQASLNRLGHPLDHNVIIHARSLEDLQRADDFRKFAEWAADADALDYLDASLRPLPHEAVA